TLEPFEILTDRLPIRIVFDPGVNVFDPIADPAGNSVPIFVDQIANIVDQDFQIGRHETENGRAKLPHYVAQPRPCPPKILGSFSFFFRYGFRRSLGLHLPDLRRLQQNPFRRSVLILNDYAKPMSLTANISALSLHLPNDRS